MATKAAKAAAAARASMGSAPPKVPEPPRDMASDLDLKSDYRFEDIDWFDARRGYKRFAAGVGVSAPSGHGDLWRSVSGDVVGRMTSQGNRIAFKVVTKSGVPVLDEEIDEVHDDLMELLSSWTSEGAPDWSEM